MSDFSIPLLQKDNTFPDIQEAICHRDGLVAIGGDLSVSRLLSAYRQGIFPWFSEDQPICWWVTSPRMVLLPENFHVSHSLKKSLHTRHYEISVDLAFDQVINACAVQKRPQQEGTWIVPAMQQAYIELHEAGYAHSFEFWQDGQLMGGLYGVVIGQVFCGESMFARCPDASKIAFVHAFHYLVACGVQIIDCQMYTEHLARFGAKLIEFPAFTNLLVRYQIPELTKDINPGVLFCNTNQHGLL